MNDLTVCNTAFSKPVIKALLKTQARTDQNPTIKESLTVRTAAEFISTPENISAVQEMFA